MSKSSLPSNIQALFEEYRRVLDEFIDVIKPIDDSTLTKVMDSKTRNTDCRSIQSILTHVVLCGYVYTYYLETLGGIEATKPKRITHNASDEYINALNKMLEDAENSFSEHGAKIMKSGNTKTITVSWGQVFDIEQILEHAIVHIMRHRRQIEKFLNK